jgi:P pilus assembly chaperone PapD
MDFLLRRTCRPFLIAFALLALTAGGLARAQQPDGADLNISPKRLVLGGANRSGVVYVFNRGTSGASYAIDLVDRVMLEDGQIIPLDEIKAGTDAAGAAGRLQSAKVMITFSPRRVTLGPGESQTIRVRVLPPQGLKAGEYRTHLTVATLPPEDAGLTAEQAAATNEDELSTRVVALLALSIPLIVRQDTTPGAVTIAGPALRLRTDGDAQDSPGSVELQLARTGDGSSYGNLEVLAQKGNAKPESIGAMKGIAVYPEIAVRAATIPLVRLPVAGEQVTVRYTDDDATPGKVLATANIDVR